MSEPVEKHNVTEHPLPSWPTYIGKCCREWVLPIGHRGGRCGLCGEVPTFLREDTHDG